MIRVHDGLFDKKWIDELSLELIKTPWYPSNTANGHTYPYKTRGTHLLLGNTIFYKKGFNNIITTDNWDLIEKLQNCFNYFTEKFETQKELVEIHLNLQFSGMNGTIHTDGNVNQTAYIMMLSNEFVDEDEGGEFYHQPSNEYVKFKPGRLIEITASDPHKGLAFKTPNVCRFSIKWVGNNIQN